MFEYSKEQINLSDTICLKSILINDNIYNHKIYKNDEEVGALIYEKTDNGLFIKALNVEDNNLKYEVLNLIFNNCKDNIPVSIKLENVNAITYFLDIKKG